MVTGHLQNLVEKKPLELNPRSLIWYDITGTILGNAFLLRPPALVPEIVENAIAYMIGPELELKTDTLWNLTDAGILDAEASGNDTWKEILSY